MLSENAFQIDDHQDQNLASDGRSRYGAYLRDKRRLFFHNGPDSPPTTDPVEFAVAAWSIATPPIMSPGYATSHPRIPGQDDPLGRRPPCCARGRDRRPSAADHQPSAVAVVRVGPGRLGSPLARPHDNNHLTVLTTVTIRVPLNPTLLPDPTYTSGIPNTTCAKIAVAAMCRMVNAELATLLTAIDTPARRRTTSASLL